jgi:hypothetical protein
VVHRAKISGSGRRRAAARRGAPIILTVAAAMHAAGRAFYQLPTVSG